jgi:hypothetical protein
MAALREIVFDCERPAALARFWSALLDGYRIRAYDAAEIERLAALGLTPETDPAVLVDGPGPILCFQLRPEAHAPPLEKVRSRVHLDVEVPDRQAEIERLRALGASVERETAAYTVMRDPEGNAFCVVQKLAQRQA